MSSRLDETSLSNDQLLRIYRSPDGIIWVCSYRGGVNILDPRVFKFKQYKNLVPAHEKMNSTYSVVSLCEDADHHIWIGKDGQGIDILDPKTGQVRHLYGNHSSGPLPNNNIQALHCDRKGNVWIGTYMAGAARYNPATRKYTYFRHDPKNPKGPGSNNIWKIYEDRRGYIWFGTFGDGLDRMDPRTGLFRHYQFDPADTTSLNDRYVIEIFEDRRGVLWMGTRKGLCRYNPRTDKFLRIKNLIGEGSVYNICEDDAGHLWYGTDKGLVCYDTASRSMTLYDRKNGLRGLAVYGTVKDNHHKLWVSTNQGISCFNMLQNRFRNYILNDGLQDLEFNFTAVLQSSEGIIYFGGKNGMNFFNPDSLQDNLMVPPVYFTGLKVLGKPVRISAKKGMLTRHINFEKRIVLRHWQNVFSIDFAALNYINSANNRYACMLEGFDNNWNDLGNNHEVTYTNLDAGKYVLKVQASNNDGVWNREGARIEIIVLPPWWKTWWARVIFYFLLACLLFAVYYVRVAFFRNQQKRLMKLVKERTIQLEEVAVSLEEKQEEINSQNEELATANNMLVAQKDMILEQNQELDHHRSKLELLVEERTREYLAAKENAEESDRLKSSFLANLSHEIRTPLNAILGFSSLLGDSELDSIERAEYNRIIQSSSDTLLDLISDILDISKIEAGLLELDLQPVTVGNVILDMKGIYDLFLKREDIGLNKPVHLQLAIEDEVRGMTILTDKVRLEQIISNLLSNALKFTRRGYIELGCFKTRDKANLEFYVKDTGVGIKKEHQQLIFERFRKVEDDKSQVQRGTGLGLAISAQLVALLGGSIQVDSTPGVGSLFSFTIPLVPAGNEVLSAVPEVTTGQMPDFGQCRVLVAEDEPSNFQYISKLLKKAGIDVLHAEDGMEVLEQLSKVKDIRLILMDIKMPRKDGIETLHEIVKLEMDIPVIAQTAYALADEIVKLKKEGFVDYISKPIQAAQLYTVLGKFLKPSH
jgi:signal transduction histidine kinase/CheY-like chemotaxis protein/streptogramin lyase